MTRLYRILKHSLLILAAALPLLTHAQNSPQGGIITAGGTLTDIVFAVGGGDKVIGVDTSSTSPSAVHKLPKVGYYRNLSAEGVLSFNPKQVWVLEGAGSERALAQIETAGVPVAEFGKPTTLSELYTLIHQVADQLGTPDRAEPVINSIKDKFHPVSRAQPLSGLFVLQVSERGVVAAGHDSVPDLLFSQSDITNVVDHKGFKTVSREHLLVNQPDFIVAPSHVVDAAGGREQFCQNATLQLLNAGQSCQLLVMDSLLALGMTTRIAEAHEALLAYVNDL